MTYFPTYPIIHLLPAAIFLLSPSHLFGSSDDFSCGFHIRKSVLIKYFLFPPCDLHQKRTEPTHSLGNQDPSVSNYDIDVIPIMTLSEKELKHSESFVVDIPLRRSHRIWFQLPKEHLDYSA